MNVYVSGMQVSLRVYIADIVASNYSALRLLTAGSLRITAGCMQIGPDYTYVIPRLGVGWVDVECKPWNYINNLSFSALCACTDEAKPSLLFWFVINVRLVA